MRQRLFALILVLALVGTIQGLQAGSAQQPATGAQTDQAAQQQKDQAGCMEWAKQQAGLSNSGNAQQPAASGDKSGAAAPADNSAANKPADKSAGAKPADNSAQSSATSGLSGAASSAAGAVGLGGVANTKTTELIKEAYKQCMAKKGHQVK